MKTGILYVIGGTTAIVAVLIMTVLMFLPTSGEQPSLAGIISRLVTGLVIGIWLLPSGVNRIKTARQQEVK